MQITINLPPDLEQDLIRQAAQANIPLQALVLQALSQLANKPCRTVSQWSEVLLSYSGSNFPAFESYRDELLLPREPELF